MKDVETILKGLKAEIETTLFFFIATDVEIYGHITKGTVEAFETQKVKFPAILKEFVK